MQFADPAESEYVPARQAIQPSAAVSFKPLYFPIAHDTHTGYPTNEALPPAHVVQFADPAESEYVPARQAIQPSATESLEPRYFPVGQLEQTADA